MHEPGQLEMRNLWKKISNMCENRRVEGKWINYRRKKTQLSSIYLERKTMKQSGRERESERREEEKEREVRESGRKKEMY